MKKILFMTLCVLLCAQALPAKRIKKNIYTVLEKEVPPSKFDNDGFYKRTLSELDLYLERSSREAYAGGYYCMAEQPFMAGFVAGSSVQGTLFSKGDTLEVAVKDAMAGCSKGTAYVVVERHGSGVYKVVAELESVEKALKQGRCVAKVTEIYGPIKRNSEVAYPISSKDVPTVRIMDLITGKVENIWGNRACVKFASGQALPKAGTVVYFYRINDPQNNTEIDPFVVATGKLINVSGQFGTAIIEPSGTPVLKGTSVTTRF